MGKFNDKKHGSFKESITIIKQKTGGIKDNEFNRNNKTII